MSSRVFKVDIVTAIQAINSKAVVTVLDDDAKKITWLDETTPIDEADILAKQKQLQAEYDAKEYQRDRAEAYPSMADQLDDIYHNGVDEWKKTIKAVKDKYPKE
jgi:hypothetical protein|tara:strand:+ start:554 stop:865 length:312 start_codon:yes stop_codon:yes gene_type:complete